ncbi:MAG: serine hydrolase domain-containing protein [Flavobacteriaceae bacterium]
MFSFINSLFGQKKIGFEKADAILAKLVRQKKIPGIAITVTKNGEKKFSKGYGYSNIKTKTTVNPEATVFRIGSVSKPIAATGLAKMVEKNQINLNDSIYKYVPGFPKKKYNFTLKQLGGHLAGIRNYKGNEFMNKEHLSIREGVALFENDPLLFKPGNDYLYTSYSWNLVSLAMQEVVGKPFEVIIKEEVLKPLSLSHTFADKQQDVPEKATFYTKKRWRHFVEVPKVNNYYKLAGGGYLSTTDDISKLGNAYLSENFISDAVKKEFISSQQINDKPTYYGIGWQASFDHNNRPYYGHVGNGYGGYGIFYVYPKDEVVVTILMNCSNPNQNKKLNAVIDAVFEGLNAIDVGVTSAL